MRKNRNLKTADEILRRYKRGDKVFKGITLEGDDLSKKRLSGIDFEGSTLMECNFEQSIMSRSNLNATNLRGANLKGTNLSKATLTGCDCRGAMMKGINLSGADLRWANLEGVNLSGSNISGANFDGANLKNANLRDANPGKLWWKANLEEAKLDGTVLPNGTVFELASSAETD